MSTPVLQPALLSATLVDGGKQASPEKQPRPRWACALGVGAGLGQLQLRAAEVVNLIGFWKECVSMQQSVLVFCATKAGDLVFLCAVLADMVSCSIRST